MRGDPTTPPPLDVDVDVDVDAAVVLLAATPAAGEFGSENEGV
jgi:hypothetical protein